MAHSIGSLLACASQGMALATTGSLTSAAAADTICGEVTSKADARVLIGACLPASGAATAHYVASAGFKALVSCLVQA